tara:strand:+ start:1334 stop:1456 length:123 start_codon:yes stop_codon:yes gene_type:complete
MPYKDNAVKLDILMIWIRNEYDAVVCSVNTPYPITPDKCR